MVQRKLRFKKKSSKNLKKNWLAIVISERNFKNLVLRKVPCRPKCGSLMLILVIQTDSDAIFLFFQKTWIFEKKSFFFWKVDFFEMKKKMTVFGIIVGSANETGCLSDLGSTHFHEKIHFPQKKSFFFFFQKMNKKA